MLGSPQTGPNPSETNGKATSRVVASRPRRGAVDGDATPADDDITGNHAKPLENEAFGHVGGNPNMAEGV